MLVYRSRWLGLHCRIFALYNTLKYVKSIHHQFTLRLTLQFITQHCPSALVASVKQRPHTPWSVITTVIAFAFAVVFTVCGACCISTRRIIIILTVSRCCSFCRRFLTTRPSHSSSDGTTLAACASAHHIQTMHSDARSRVWKRATVLDGHGGVCVMTYRQVSTSHQRSAQKGGFRYTAHSSYIRIEILLLQLQLHRRGITGRLRFNGSPPFPPSRNISRPICLWLHYPC